IAAVVAILASAPCLFRICSPVCPPLFFFFNDTATTEIYTLSLHDALPISKMNIYLQMNDVAPQELLFLRYAEAIDMTHLWSFCLDRKSTRLNSSHVKISYAVFCLKKKNVQALAERGRCGEIPSGYGD